MEVPRRYWRYLDWPLILAVAALIAIGFVVIYSASYSQLTQAGISPFYYVTRQFLGLVLGLAAVVVIISIDYRAWKRWTRLIYIASIGMLGLLLVMGTTVFGSQRWFRIGPMSIQPSELAKLALVLVLAKHLEGREQLEGWNIWRAFCLGRVPAGLIILQPDLGTAAIFAGLAFAMLFFAGADLRKLGLCAAVLAVAAMAAIYVSWKGWIPIIKPYQLSRLLVFLDPYADRNNAGVEYYPIYDRHRLRGIPQERAFLVAPKVASFSARQPHRLCLLCNRRRIRLHRHLSSPSSFTRWLSGGDCVLPCWRRICMACFWLREQ